MSWNRSLNAIGARDGFNRKRSRAVAARRARLRELIDEYGTGYGSQRKFAEILGVSEVTISRDMVGVMASDEKSRCPACGTLVANTDVKWRWRPAGTKDMSLVVTEVEQECARA